MYSVDSVIKFGNHDWRVLNVQDDKILILSENIIETRAYHYTDEYTTWSECDLRKYLNGDFLNKTFSQEDRDRILDTEVVTNSNTWFGTDGGLPTTDKIFLLSLEEVIQYFGDSGQLKSRSGKVNWFSDEYLLLRVAYDKSGESSWWWLRSPGKRANRSACVNCAGGIHVRGRLVDDYIAGYAGVRSALWLKANR